jgi:hypothetical protein
VLGFRWSIVDDHWAAEPERATRYLDAGADGYLAGTSTEEVAAHVRALTRPDQLRRIS